MRKTILILFLMAGSLSAQSQEKPNNWSVGAGLGWFHYINTIQMPRVKNAAVTDHVGYTFRFMWEPEHRLSMGLESGYYTIYSIDSKPAGNWAGGSAKLTALPLLLSFRIRVLPDFYLSGGPGLTIMFSEVNVLGSEANSSFLSLANLHISALYRKKINDRFDIGGEVKFVNFGKTEDYGYSVQLIGSYHFRFRK
ncbi:MAG: outer membrane beta-barrel protein [Cyclobacteriaceae bacterium]|nr:outer membrane beta-barrel protein [Cyclobacteriaceae bacterium]